MVYGETGRYPLYIDSAISSLRYWFKPSKMPMTRFPKQALIMLKNSLDTNTTHKNRGICSSYIWAPMPAYINGFVAKVVQTGVTVVTVTTFKLASRAGGGDDNYVDSSCDMCVCVCVRAIVRAYVCLSVSVCFCV